jgi:hypothetical protein
MLEPFSSFFLQFFCIMCSRGPGWNLVSLQNFYCVFFKQWEKNYIEDIYSGDKRNYPHLNNFRFLHLSFPYIRKPMFSNKTFNGARSAICIQHLVFSYGGNYTKYFRLMRIKKKIKKIPYAGKLQTWSICLLSCQAEKSTSSV